jgi:hypothetical protein
MNLLDGLVIAYHLDGDLEPAHGYRALQGSTSFSQGKFGQAATFSGVSTYLSTPWSLVGYGKSRTISFWAYPEDPSLVEIYVFVNNTSAGPPALWSVYKDSTVPALFHGGISSQSGVDLAINEWNHLVYTFDATTGQYVLYQNGVATISGISQDDVTLQGNSTLFLSGYVGLPVQGMIDELVIWDRALSASEVLEVGLAPYPFGESSCQVEWDDSLLVYSSGFQAALGVRTPNSGVGSWD